MGDDLATRRARHVEVVGELLAAVSALRFDDALAMLHEDVVFELPYERVVSPMDKAGVTAMFAGLARSFQRFTVTPVEIVEALDPDVLIVRYEGDCLSRDGTVDYRNSYVAFFGFTDGRISRWREYANPVLTRRMNERLAAVTG